ncbi:MAG: HD-like signal output (HDOD) protein [Phycisphaerales bacterium]|jgi:HD-like signal output (HDOD) protein
MADLNLLDGFENLRPIPITVTRVASLLAEPEPDLQEIAEIVRVDEALSLAVLRRANSSAYGVPGREFNLREATVRLGSKGISKIVLEQQMGEVFDGDLEAFGLRRGAMWRGALGGALAAESLARTHAPGSEELCFVCALLRDVGKLLLDAKYGADYETKLEEHLSPTTAFCEAERAAFGADHAEIGAAMASHWGLPARVVEAIRFHHEPPTPDTEGHDVVFDIVHAADIVSLWGGLAIGCDGLQYKLSPHVRESLKLKRETAEFEITKMWTNLRVTEEALAPHQPGRRSA